VEAIVVAAARRQLAGIMAGHRQHATAARSTTARRSTHVERDRAQGMPLWHMTANPKPEQRMQAPPTPQPRMAANIPAVDTKVNTSNVTTAESGSG
jgi:hypothetical protein